MTVLQALRHAKIPSLDAELLLAHVLKKPGTWLLAHPETPLSPPQLKQFEALVERRKNHEPVAYITGEKEFYGRPFFVDRRVLIPRPSTETLVDEIKRLFVGRRGAPVGRPVDAVKKGTFAEVSPSTGRPSGAPLRTTSRMPHITKADNDIVIFTHLFKNKFLIRNSQFSILDIGTGSGCIGITLALEIPDVPIICTDISDDALEVARENAKRHNVLHHITFLNANLILNPNPNPKEPLKNAAAVAAIRKSLRFATVGACPERSRGEPSLRVFQRFPNPFLVVSNPPYVPTTEKLPPDVIKFEPHEALFAGPDGMDVLHPLHERCRRHPSCIGCVLEMRLEQAKKLTSYSESRATLPLSRK